MSALVVLACVAVAPTASAGSIITIDDFDHGDICVTVPGPAPPTATDAAMASCLGCIGGDRELTVNTYESESMFRDASGSVDTVTGRFFASTEPTVSGDVTVVYGATSDLNQNLTDTAIGPEPGLGLEIHVSDPATDGHIEITFTLTDGMDNTAVGVLMLGDISTLTRVELRFSEFTLDPGFDFSDVDRIEMHVNLEDPNQQVDVDSFFVSTVPEPATVTLLGMGLLGVAAVSRRRRRHDHEEE